MSVRWSEEKVRRILQVSSVSVLIALVIGTTIWLNSFPSEQPSGTGSDPDHASGPTLPLGELATVPIDLRSSWSKTDDPNLDGWDSEALSEKISQSLNALGQLVVHPEQINVVAADRIAAGDFTCDRLLPESRQTVFADKAIRVERMLGDPSPANQPSAAIFRGPTGLVDAVRVLAGPFRNAVNVRFKFKLIQFEFSGNDIATRQLFTISGRTDTGFVEQNATWLARWTRAGDGETPKLLQLDVQRFEQVTSRSGNEPLFVDCTNSVLGQNDSFQRQLLYGMNHWLERMQDTRYFTPLGNPGLALGDVNGDGLDDLYVCQEAGLPNRLYLQQTDGTAVDASSELGVDWLESSRSALLVDLDNDGDQDLVVAIIGGVIIASNDRQMSFTIRSLLSTDDDVMSLCSADYDNDGDLDIYTCVNYPNDFFAQSEDISVLGGASNRVYHDANNAGRNALFRNDISPDDWQFTDVTTEVGMDMNNRRFSLAASWEDFDIDGDQDLYVANDFGRNNLFWNDGGQDAVRFVDVAQDAEVEDSASGMSVAWADVDRDGQMDLYVGNMFSAAGGRITSDPRFKADASDEIRTRLRRFARGSSLFKRLSDGSFQDVSIAAGVNVGRWAWSSSFLDINNDGWEDILVANGYITTDDTSDL